MFPSLAERPDESFDGGGPCLAVLELLLQSKRLSPRPVFLSIDELQGSTRPGRRDRSPLMVGQSPSEIIRVSVVSATITTL